MNLEHHIMNNNHVNHNVRLYPARFMIFCRAQGVTYYRTFNSRAKWFIYLFTNRW